MVIPEMLDESQIATAQARFPLLFRGEFETGLQPDEWDWREGRDDLVLTRQICNGWKADRTIAEIVLRPDIGAAATRLRGWPGARLDQDNVIWKPPGAKPLGIHQDESYQNWIVPSEMRTCWISLDPTTVDGGTIEYVPGSYRWPLSGKIDQFHRPDDALADLNKAAAGRTIDIVAIEVPAGNAVLHHGRIWHGSQTNRSDRPRRSVVAHCVSSNAKFHRRNVGAIYGRYRMAGSVEMDESFFLILWRADGYRSPWIDQDPDD